mgnify:FL=1
MKKNEVIWNTLGSFLYSMFNAIILMICTRLNGIEIAGIFSICYATCCILNSIGDWGIRIYQVTDTNRKYKFEDYFYARVLAVFGMIVIGVIFTLISKYSDEKLFICITLILVRAVDNFSETFQSELQLNNRLDLAGKFLLLRNLIEIVTFLIVNILTQNIYLSFGSILCSSVIMLLGLDVHFVKKMITLKMKINKKKIYEILKECFPLAISTLISVYIINSVKYAIDNTGNNIMQTYFNILYMPTFVINLISILIIKPFLKPFGDYWNNREYENFIKIILKMVLILTIITFFIIFVSSLIGIPILNILYNVDLNQYKIHLIILLISGLFYACSTVIFYAIGTIRKQKSTTIVYGITAIVAIAISNILVKKFEILGATVSTLLIMLILLLGMIIAFVYGYRKSKKIC